MQPFSSLDHAVPRAQERSVDGGGETIGTGGTMRRGRRFPAGVRRRALPEFKTGSSRQLSSISFSARPRRRRRSSAAFHHILAAGARRRVARHGPGDVARDALDFVGFFTACDTRSAASMRFSAASAAATSARVGGTWLDSLSLEDS